MPKVGSKQDKKTRHTLPNGFKKLLISCEKDIELLLMNNRTYCGEIAQGISSGKRLRIVARAKELNVRLTNAQAKAKKESTEWTWWAQHADYLYCFDSLLNICQHAAILNDSTLPVFESRRKLASSGVTLSSASCWQEISQGESLTYLNQIGGLQIFFLLLYLIIDFIKNKAL